MQRSFEVAQARGSSGDGEDVSMEWADRGRSGTVEGTVFVLEMCILIVEGGWLGSITDRDGESAVGVDESRARAGEGQQGRTFRLGQVQSAVGETMLDWGRAGLFATQPGGVKNQLAECGQFR